MKLRMLAMAAVCALALTGCYHLPEGIGKEETTETIPVYQALPLPDLLVAIPEEFEKTSSEFYDTYYIHEDASIIITEDTDAVNTSVKDYSTKALVQYQELCYSVDVLSNEIVYAGNLPVQTLEFEYRLTEDAVPLTCITGFLSDGKSVYIITCKSGSDTYETYRDEFLMVFRSLTIDRTNYAAGN